jgi:hypothetical protein
MSESDWVNIQIKQGHGAGKVTEDQKNATIERALTMWDQMDLKLTKEQKAWAAAMMGTESGFYSKAHGKTESSDEYGLGQFTKGTWDLAMKHYDDERKNHARSHWPAVDQKKAREEQDQDSQIAVMGPWIKKTWDSAGEVAHDPQLKGYNGNQIAYGKWHGGLSKSAKGVGDYLKENWHTPDIGGYFDVTYDRAMQALKIREDREERNKMR